MKVRFNASRRVPRDPRKGLFRSKIIAFVLVIEWVFSFLELEKHLRTGQLVGGLCNWKKICRFVTNLVNASPREMLPLLNATPSLRPPVSSPFRIRRPRSRTTHTHYPPTTTSSKMSAIEVAQQEVLPKDATFHLDAGIEDPEEFLVVHELLGRGQLLNAYEVRLFTTAQIHSIPSPIRDIRVFFPVPTARAPPRAVLPVALFGGW